MELRSSVDVTYLARPSQLFSFQLVGRVTRRNGRSDVHGAFPVVMARAWRHRLASLTGAQRFIPGRPLVAAGIGNELWLYDNADEVGVGALVGVFPANVVTPIDAVDLPRFQVAGRSLQVGVEWFDEARLTLAKIRQC